MPVKLEVEDRIAWIRLDYPGALNRKTMKMLVEAIDSSESNERAKIIAMTGSGKFFSVGIDLKELAGSSSPDEAMGLFKSLVETFNRLLHVSKPLIILVNGDAFGGGAELIWTGDIVVSLKDARLVWAEAKWGLIPPLLTIIGPYYLGPARASLLAMTSSGITGTEAKELGIVSEIVDSVEELEEKAIEISSRIIANSPQAVASIKNLLTLSKISQLIEASSRELIRLSASQEALEAARMFREKREPAYKW